MVYIMQGMWKKNKAFKRDYKQRLDVAVERKASIFNNSFFYNGGYYIPYK